MIVYTINYRRNLMYLWIDFFIFGSALQLRRHIYNHLLDFSKQSRFHTVLDHAFDFNRELRPRLDANEFAHHPRLGGNCQLHAGGLQYLEEKSRDR